MQSITTIGLDIAKSVFQVHGIDAQGNVIVRRQVSGHWSALALNGSVANDPDVAYEPSMPVNT
jgi:hypothetical protein